MTVTPIAAAGPSPGTPQPLGFVSAATGVFRSPSGRVGTFAGCYRLERLLSQFGQLAAAGVFTGELTDADGSRIGTGSRRLTVAAEVGVEDATPVVRIGPLDVNLLGFLVAVDGLQVAVPDGQQVCAEATGEG